MHETNQPAHVGEKRCGRKRSERGRHERVPTMCFTPCNACGSVFASIVLPRGGCCIIDCCERAIWMIAIVIVVLVNVAAEVYVVGRLHGCLIWGPALVPVQHTEDNA